jgi:hypothetical protein
MAPLSTGFCALYGIRGQPVDNFGIMPKSLAEKGPGQSLECAFVLCQIAHMANGQIVLVTTERLGGGSPMRTLFYVAEEDPAKAVALIEDRMAPNERVEALGLLPEAAVMALGLKPQEFRSYP